MARRLQLSERFEETLGNDNVYYQPPPSVRMKYPAIVYRDSDIKQWSADNKVYRIHRGYSVMLISRDPEEPAVEKLAMYSKCIFDRAYEADGLHHWIYRIYE